MLLCEIAQLLESRLDALKTKYLPQLVQALKWLKVRNLPPGIPDGVLHSGVDDGEASPLHFVGDTAQEQTASAIFDMIAQADPDPQKKYTQWLLTLTLKGQMPLEDLYKATEYLTTFMRLKAAIPVEQRNIMAYKSLQDLFDVVKLAMDDPSLLPVSKGAGKRDIKAEMMKQARVVMDTPEYLIVVPLTQEASCYFGVNTQWCTASTTSSNYFDSYNKDGPIYIILEKKTNTRWQFHFSSAQFMDENDRSIDVTDFANSHPQVAMVLAEEIVKENPDQFSKLGEDKFIVKKWTDVDDCIDDIGTTDGKSFYKFYIKDDNWVYSADFFPNYDDDNARDLMASLEPELLTKLGQWFYDIQKNHIDITEIVENYDPSSIDDIIDLDNEVEDEDFRHVVQSAIASGLEAGAQNAAYKVFETAMERSDYLMFKTEKTPDLPAMARPGRYQHLASDTEQWTGEFQFDTEIAFVITKEQLAHSLDGFLDSDISNIAESLNAQIDMQEPRYGFDEWDQGVSKERFADDISELIEKG
jgi:hypothetical protein